MSSWSIGCTCSIQQQGNRNMNDWKCLLAYRESKWTNIKETMCVRANEMSLKVLLLWEVIIISVGYSDFQHNISSKHHLPQSSVFGSKISTTYLEIMCLQMTSEPNQNVLKTFALSNRNCYSIYGGIGHTYSLVDAANGAFKPSDLKYWPM